MRAKAPFERVARFAGAAIAFFATPFNLALAFRPETRTTNYSWRQDHKIVLTFLLWLLLNRLQLPIHTVSRYANRHFSSRYG